MIHGQGLLLEHVQSSTVQLLLFQSADQVGLNDEVAAGAVDEPCRGLHHAELLVANAVAGSVVGLQVDGDIVSLLPDLVGSGLQLDVNVQHLGSDVGIVSDGLHAEAVDQDACQALADTAGADEADGVAAQVVGAGQLIANVEVAAAHLVIDMTITLSAHQDQHGSVLGDGVHVAGGAEDHADLLLGSIGNIDVVQTCALLGDDLQVGAGIHHGGGDLVNAAEDSVHLVVGDLLDPLGLAVAGRGDDLNAVCLQVLVTAGVHMLQSQNLETHNTILLRILPVSPAVIFCVQEVNENLQN